MSCLRFWTPLRLQQPLPLLALTGPTKACSLPFSFAPTSPFARGCLFTTYDLSTEESIRLGPWLAAKPGSTCILPFSRWHFATSKASTYFGRKDLAPLTDSAWCLAFFRRFGVLPCRIPPSGQHHSSCASSTGLNCAHVMVCYFLRLCGPGVTTTGSDMPLPILLAKIRSLC